MNAQPLNRKRQVQTLWHTVVRTMCLCLNAGGLIAPFSFDAATQCANRPTFSWAVSGQLFVRKTAARKELSLWSRTSEPRNYPASVISFKPQGSPSASRSRSTSAI